MPKYNKDTEYDEEQGSGLYAKDSLDNYNEDLSKKAVGSIFNNIERSNSYNSPDEYITETLDTNFNIQSDTERQKLVKDLFDTTGIDVEPRKRPRQKRPLSQHNKNTVHQNQNNTQHQNINPQNNQYNTQNNPAYISDDNTISRGYVTRGNHQPVTPAMAAKRKKVTLMESQRVPIVTDEDVKNHKKQNSNTNYLSKQQFSKDYSDNKPNEKYQTRNQKEIAEYFEKEAIKREQNFENTLHRINQKNKHYTDIINSTNRRLTAINEETLNKSSNATNTTDVENQSENKIEKSATNQAEENKNIVKTVSKTDTNNITSYLKQDVYSNDDDFENNVDSDVSLDFDDTTSNEYLKEKLNLSTEDLDQDFEDTIHTNAHSDKVPNQPKPKTTIDNTYEEAISNTGENQVFEEDYYDLETDSYVSKKSKYTTGEVKRINDTFATEVRVEDIDALVFDDCNDADMEYLRKTIKEKSKANKMQSINEQFQEFEQQHRNFNSNNGQPNRKNRPNTNKNYNTSKNKKVSRDTQEQDIIKQNTNFSTDDDYFAKYDTDANNIPDNLNDTNSFDTYNTQRVPRETSRYDTDFTSRIKTVDFDNDDDYYYDNYQRRFNISLIANIVLFVLFAGSFIYSNLKTSSLQKQIDTLNATNTELIDENSKVTEIQMDLDYYKNLYENTEEGQASIFDSEDSSVDSDDDTDNSTNLTDSTYTVSSGDTLSSISKQMYGNSNDYQKIIDANSLTSDSLTIGQVLIIPE